MGRDASVGSRKTTVQGSLNALRKIDFGDRRDNGGVVYDNRQYIPGTTVYDTGDRRDNEQALRDARYYATPSGYQKAPEGMMWGGTDWVAIPKDKGGLFGGFNPFNPAQAPGIPTLTAVLQGKSGTDASNKEQANAREFANDANKQYSSGFTTVVKDALISPMDDTLTALGTSDHELKKNREFVEGQGKLHEAETKLVVNANNTDRQSGLIDQGDRKQSTRDNAQAWQQAASTTGVAASLGIPIVSWIAMLVSAIANGRLSEADVIEESAAYKNFAGTVASSYASGALSDGGATGAMTSGGAAASTGTGATGAMTSGGTAASTGTGATSAGTVATNAAIAGAKKAALDAAVTGNTDGKALGSSFIGGALGSALPSSTSLLGAAGKGMLTNAAGQAIRNDGDVDWNQVAGAGVASGIGYGTGAIGKEYGLGKGATGTLIGLLGGAAGSALTGSNSDEIGDAAMYGALSGAAKGYGQEYFGKAGGALGGMLAKNYIAGEKRDAVQAAMQQKYAAYKAQRTADLRYQQYLQQKQGGMMRSTAQPAASGRTSQQMQQLYAQYLAQKRG